jgi:hypothetical protein
VVAAGSTPLVLDGSGDDQVARTYFSYKGCLEDVSGLIVPFAKSGLKRSDLTERCRASLVRAMKTGTTFALYLGACTIEHADWKKKLCHKDVFPTEVFVGAGKRLLQPPSNPKYKALFRESELEHGQAIVRDGFKVVVISSLDPYDYEQLLEDSIPLGYMTPLFMSNE